LLIINSVETLADVYLKGSPLFNLNTYRTLIQIVCVFPLITLLCVGALEKKLGHQNKALSTRL